jgi:hypothetical protein
MANFFIRRPIVAIVISILMVLMGLFSLKGLSIEQYPFLAPPSIRVTATYPGASAVAVEQSVATPVEQEVNGVDKMIYMKSSNTSDGPHAARCQLRSRCRPGHGKRADQKPGLVGSGAAAAGRWSSRVSPSKSKPEHF